MGDHINYAVGIGKLESIASLLSSTNGRDKMMRFVDYTTRALSFYLSTAFPNHSQVSTVQAFESHLIISRKLFRIGRSLEFIVAFIKVLNSTNDPAMIALAFGKSLGYGSWLFYDNLVYLAKLKLIGNRNVVTWDKKSAYYWFLGIICAVLIDVRKIIQNIISGERTNSSTYLQLARNLLDLLVPGFKLNFYLAKVIAPNKGIVGLTGSLSSLISIYLMWPPPPK